MPISNRLRTIFAEVEAVYDTAETLVGADAIHVIDLNPNPLESARILERAIINSSIQDLQTLYAGSLFGFTFGVELTGSGTIDVAPQALGDLLRACGLDETIVAATSVTYTPNDSTPLTHESVTIGYREGVNYRQVSGCRGNAEIMLEAGQIPRINFTMMGHIVSEAQAAAPTPAFPAILPEPFLGATFVIAAFAAPIQSVSLNTNNQMSISQNPNAADGFGDIRITSRKAGGNVNPEVEGITTKDYIGEIRADTTQIIQTGVIGSVAGNKYALSVPLAYWKNLSYGDREEILVFDGEFGAKENVGDDSFSLQLT